MIPRLLRSIVAGEVGVGIDCLLFRTSTVLKTKTRVTPSRDKPFDLWLNQPRNSVEPHKCDPSRPTGTVTTKSNGIGHLVSLDTMKISYQSLVTDAVNFVKNVKWTPIARHCLEVMVALGSMP